MRKISILSILALLSTSQMHGMKRCWNVTDMAQQSLQAPQAQEEKKEQEKTLMALDSGTDPNRYGPLVISEPDHTDADLFISAINTYDNKLTHYTEYHATRNRIANAIKCDHYLRNFAKIATEKNDLPLWELLITQQQHIKRQHKIDVASARCVNRENPPLYDAISVEIASLLVEKGKASISRQIGYSGETVIHRACYYDRHPDLLQYYLTKHPLGAHKADKNGNTPLHILCQSGFGATYFAAHYLKNVLAKLAILKKYSVNFFLKNGYEKSVLDILQDQMQGRHPKNVDTLMHFSQEHITKSINEQCDAKCAEVQNENCSICFDPLATDGKPLKTDDKVRMFDCLHFFHRDCIKKWHKKVPTCPICRKEEPVIENEDNDLDSDDDELSSSVYNYFAGGFAVPDFPDEDFDDVEEFDIDADNISSSSDDMSGGSDDQLGVFYNDEGMRRSKRLHRE